MVKLLFAALSLAYMAWGAVALWIVHDTFPQPSTGTLFVRSDYQRCQLIRTVPLELRKLRNVGDRNEDTA